MLSRGFLSTAVALSLVIVGSSLTRTGWGQVAPGEDPAQNPARGGTADLLRTAPFDRIILNDNSALLVEPISPRPLPPYDPKKDRANEGRRLKSERENLIKVGDGDLLQPINPAEKTRRAGGEDSRVKDDDLDPNNSIAIHLLQAQGQAEIRDFKVRRAQIKRIDYFEDLLLAEADRLVQSRKFAQAFECLLFVKARAPDWQGQDEVLNRLLYAEGSGALIDGDFDRGVRLLRELLERNKEYPGLVEQLASAYLQRIEKALGLGLYARGRAILHQFEEIAPRHTNYLAARSLFLEAARKRLEASKAATGLDRLDSAAEALRIWPEHEEARAHFERGIL